MFEIGWTEILVIAVVAIVVVGPKDLPRLLRTIGNMVGKLRRMSGDFQRQFNAALKEAEREVDLADAKNAVTDATKTVAEVRRSMVAPLRDMSPLKSGATGDAAKAVTAKAPATTPPPGPTAPPRPAASPAAAAEAPVTADAAPELAAAGAVTADEPAKTGAAAVPAAGEAR